MNCSLDVRFLCHNWIGWKAGENRVYLSKINILSANKCMGGGVKMLSGNIDITWMNQIKSFIYWLACVLIGVFVRNLRFWCSMYAFVCRNRFVLLLSCCLEMCILSGSLLVAILWRIFVLRSCECLKLGVYKVPCRAVATEWLCWKTFANVYYFSPSLSLSPFCSLPFSTNYCL